MVRRAVVLGLCFALFTIQPTLGGAAVITEAFSAADISVAPGVADFFVYSGGTTTSWTSTADFDGGTYTSTNSVDLADSVVLDRIGPTGVAAPDPSVTWWDTDWTNRRCYAIDHTATGAATVTEYQIRVDFPVDALVTGAFLQADLGDLRAVGADGITSLPLWPDATQADTIWVQMDTINAAATTDLCLYFGYSPGIATSPANHTEAAVFTYTSAKDIYYTVADVFAVPGAAINVVSYIDNNDVTRDGATTATLTVAGDLATFDAVGNTSGSVFSVLGPISASGIGDGADSLVPISFAGTTFISPVSRDSQQFSFVAPFADAAVDLYDGATLVTSFTVAAGTPYTHTTDNITVGNAAIIESDVPVLVTHRSDLAGDAAALYPATSGDFLAIHSSEVLVGFGTDTSQVDIAGSDGTIGAATGDRGEAVSIAGGSPQGGVLGDGLLLTSAQPVGAMMHEDGDGNESVTVLPLAELGALYWMPTDTQYIASACATAASADVPLTVSPPGAPIRPVTCTGGPDVAWAVDTADMSVTTSGISISSDNGTAFATYYEDLGTGDQVGLLGMKQGRQYTWPEPVVTAGGDEGIYETSGTWESETIDTGAGTGVFGLVSIEGATPTATTLRVQIASAPSGTPATFVGPDGTGGTYFELASMPAVADFSHDGDGLIRVRAELATTDPVNATPQLDLVSVDAHLPQLPRSLSGTPTTALTTSIDPTVTTSYLLRVKTSDPTITGSEATAVYRGASNLANLAEETVRFSNDGAGVNSVQQSNTQPTEPPILFQQSRPHSIVLDHSAVAAGTTTIFFAWQLDYTGGGSIFFETDFAVEVTAP